MSTPVTPAEARYRVVVEHTLVYEIEAESPEMAADIVDQGDDVGQPIDIVASLVTAVVAADGSWCDPDLRAPVKCRGGCGSTLPAHTPGGECTSCYLGRLARERQAREAADA